MSFLSHLTHMNQHNKSPEHTLPPPHKMFNFPCFIILLLTPITLGDNYCSLNCTDIHGNQIPHTVCERQPPCNPAQACGPKPRPLQSTKEVREWFLKRHNQHRHRVARGGVRFRGRNIKAGNMHKLVWDEELEYTARCWVNACDVGRDYCRITEKFNVSVGQNRYDRFVKENEEELDEKGEIYRAVDHWFNEARSLNESIINRYDATVAPQAAQLLWARSTHIGCASLEYVIEDHKIRTTICNYGPGGNVDGSAIWLIGEPCSKCGRGKKACCDEEFDALCAIDKNDSMTLNSIQKIGFVAIFMVVVLIK